jgi:AraC-like DNA-binding protein
MLGTHAAECPSDSIGRGFLRRTLAGTVMKRVAAYIDDNIDTNIPPRAYVAKRRVLRGQELMRNSQASLSEIALACGMCDQAHFIRVFHRTVGLSPGRWRRKFVGESAGDGRTELGDRFDRLLVHASHNGFGTQGERGNVQSCRSHDDGNS